MARMVDFTDSSAICLASPSVLLAHSQHKHASEASAQITQVPAVLELVLALTLGLGAGEEPGQAVE